MRGRLTRWRCAQRAHIASESLLVPEIEGRFFGGGKGQKKHGDVPDQASCRDCPGNGRQDNGRSPHPSWDQSRQRCSYELAESPNKSQYSRLWARLKVIAC